MNRAPRSIQQELTTTICGVDGPKVDKRRFESMIRELVDDYWTIIVPRIIPRLQDVVEIGK